MATKNKLLPIEAVRRLPSIHASQIPHYDLPTELNSLAEEIFNEIESARASTQGVSSKTQRQVKLHVIWFLNCLRICFESIPRCCLALPKRSNEYGKRGVFKGNISYVHTQKILAAMMRMGLIETTPGVYISGKRGYVTRISLTTELSKELAKAAYIWSKPEIISDLQQLIILRDELKKNITTPKTRQTTAWRKNLIEINDALTDSTICLWLKDHRLAEIGMNLKQNKKDLSDPFINYRNCQLRRIFSRGKLSLGGRFYGGWWQMLPSELRRHIYIDGMPTVECDYSGMSLRLLYAKENKPFPSSDPYDIGLEVNSRNRGIIKRFVNALLNDESNRFRLNESEYDALGVTHKTLKKLLYLHHKEIAHHFGTGIGLQTQYIDSCIAEEVMLNMVRGYNTVVLPIHDSFIVRQSFQDILESEMQAAFMKLTNTSAKITSDRSLADPDNQISIDSNGIFDLNISYEEMLNLRKDYSIAISYTESKHEVGLQR